MIDVDIGRWVKFLRSLFVDDLDNLPGVHRPRLCYAGENLLLSLLSVLDVELNLLHGIRHNRTVARIDDPRSQLQDLFQRPKIYIAQFMISCLVKYHGVC